MKLYDVYDNSKYIGELTLAEISEFDILTQKIRRAVGWEG